MKSFALKNYPFVWAEKAFSVALDAATQARKALILDFLLILSNLMKAKGQASIGSFLCRISDPDVCH